ncbi:unnamed protein product, partial [Amoebophrya sp. A120]
VGWGSRLAGRSGSMDPAPRVGAMDGDQDWPASRGASSAPGRGIGWRLRLVQGCPVLGDPVPVGVG